MSTATLHDIADALRAAETSGVPIAPITTTYPHLTARDAYAIQAFNVAARAADPDGAALVVGHKIGLTSVAMQQMLGVDQPDHGVLYDDRVHASGITLDTTGLIAPRVEPEFAFILKQDLTGSDLTADDVRAATEAIVPALEIIDSRITDWKIGLVDTIADNASCHCAILGADRHAIAGLDLPAAAVRMCVNGAVVQEGLGSAVLDDPATAVVWLANALAGYGITLEAGHIVLSGSMTAAVPITAGDRVIADFGPLGTVEVSAR